MRRRIHHYVFFFSVFVVCSYGAQIESFNLFHRFDYEFNAKFIRNRFEFFLAAESDSIWWFDCDTRFTISTTDKKKDLFTTTHLNCWSVLCCALNLLKMDNWIRFDIGSILKSNKRFRFSSKSHFTLCDSACNKQKMLKFNKLLSDLATFSRILNSTWKQSFIPIE